jgi:hypothetical protein
MSADLFYLPYTATTNPENLRRLLRSIQQQLELDARYGGGVPYRRYLFTDKIKPLPQEALEFFDGGVFESNPFVQAANGLRFCMSMLRNEAIRYGRSIGAEWTMLCDSDTIIEPRPFPVPVRPFAIPNVYYQERQDETAEQSLARIRSSEKSLFADGNSWFILHRDLLFTFLFNEDFSGYSWEDNEFHFRIQGSGYKAEVVDITIIHSFHPHSERRIDPKVTSHNKAMATGIRWLIENGSIDARHTPPRVEVYEAEHPSWRSQVVLCPERQQIFRLEPRATARYEVSGELYRFKWPFAQPDTFRLTDGKLLEISLFDQRERLAPRVGTGW